MTVHRVKITAEVQKAALVRAIVTTTSPLKITPGMWQALRHSRRRAATASHSESA